MELLWYNVCIYNGGVALISAATQYRMSYIRIDVTFPVVLDPEMIY